MARTTIRQEISTLRWLWSVRPYTLRDVHNPGWMNLTYMLYCVRDSILAVFGKLQPHTRKGV